MYEKFFHFKEKPFSIIPDATYFFQSRQHQLALAQLEYGLLNRVGFIVISGDIGTGKTTLIKTLINKLDGNTNVASIFNTTVNSGEFLDLVLREFGLEPDNGNQSAKLNTLKQYLTKCHENNSKSLLIIDEAQNLSIETLEEIRLLSNMEMDREYLLHIVLVGQTEIREKLMHPALSQLAQRISVHYNLAPLNEEETTHYIMYRLKVASDDAEPEMLFDSEALKAIYQHTNGIPRLINSLCDLCLVYAYADEQHNVDLNVVQEVIKNQEASGFSSMFTARPARKAGNNGDGDENTVVPASHVHAAIYDDALRILEAKVADLQSGLIAVNSTLHDLMITSSKNITRNQQQREETLSRALDVHKAEIERLKVERRGLLKRIYVLSNLTKKQSEESQKTESGQNSKEDPDSIKQAKRESNHLTIKLWWMVAGIAGAAIIFLNVLFNRALREKLHELFGLF